MMIDFLHACTDSDGGHSIEVPAGLSCQIIVRPQRAALRPLRLRVDMNGSYFELLELMIGNRSQMTDLAPINLEPYSRGFRVIEARFSCEPILVAQDFCLIVNNIGPRAARFDSHWECEVLEREGLKAYAQAQERAMKDTIKRMRDRIGHLGEDIGGTSHLDRVPCIVGKPERWTRPPPGFGWDPEGDP